MVIGHHITVLRNDETGTGRNAAGGLTEVRSGIHLTGDQHHCLHILCIDTASAHIAQTVYHGNAGIFFLCCIHLALEIFQLLCNAVFQLLRLLFPPIVHQHCGCAAASGNQCQGKNCCQHTLQAAVSGSLHLFLLRLCRRLLIITGAAGFIRRIGKRRCLFVCTGFFLGLAVLGDNLLHGNGFLVVFYLLFGFELLIFH